MLKTKQNDISARLSRITIPACAPYALLIVAVLLAYSNVYHNEFLYDDLVLIRDNKFLTSWHYIGILFITPIRQGSGYIDAFYRPLQMLLYLLIYQTVGPSTIAFHLLNITLHILNACLLYTLGVRLGFQRIGAFLAVLLWALHPVHTEAVTYMSGTGELLYGVFLLAGTLVLASDFSRRNILAACLLFVLGLLSKESAVVFPVLAMGLIFYQSENRWSPRTYLKTWPFWLLAALYFLARGTVLNFNGFYGFYSGTVAVNTTIVDRFYTFLATLPTYLRLLVWPTDLHMDRIFPIYRSLWTVQVIAGLAILTALLTGIVWKPAWRATSLAWGILWAGALFIPVSGILVPNDALISENWLYLPTAGLALGLGESLVHLSGHVRAQWLRSVLTGLVLLIACLFGAMTFQQNKVWREIVPFFTRILDYEGGGARIRMYLGAAYVEQSEYKLAIKQYRMALTSSDEAIIHFNLGAALISDAKASYALRVTMTPPDLNTPEFAEGIEQLHRALELDPDLYKACDALEYIYGYHLDDQAKALEYHAKAAAIRKKLGIE